MKFKCFILSSLAFVQFSHAQDSKNVKIHNDLNTALEQVDTDGEYLKIKKSSQLFELIAAKLDEYVLPKMKKSGELPAGFSVVKLLNMSGTSDITAGSESVKKDGNSYISKHFIQTNGSRKGILSLFGKADRPWASLEYAPANTSLLLETHLDLTALPQLLKQLAPMIEADAAKDMLNALNEQEPIAGNTLEQVLLQANTRISVIAELDSAKTWESGSQLLPAVHVTGRIDGVANFLWENYGKVVSEEIPVKSEGNVHTILSPEKIPTPWGELTPVIVIDTDSNHIWFSLSEEHLQTCRDGKSKLSDNKDFQLTNKHSRDKGAARLYLSKQVLVIAAKLINENAQKQTKEPAVKKMLSEIMKLLSTTDSISSCVSHDDKGILMTSNAPFPVVANQFNFISVYASLAGLSYGPIMQHLESSKRTEDMSKMKNIHSALIGYMAQNDHTFPNNLQQLVDGGFITERYLKLNNREITYIKGLDPGLDGSKVILYTTPDRNGKSIYCRVDGSVKMIHHFDLEKLLAK